MKSIITVIVTLLVNLSAQAADDYSPSDWGSGLHLFAGGGVNSSFYTSKDRDVDGGIGLNLKTDLTYSLNSDWALELSGNVKFNRVDGYLVWDTPLTVGIRTRLPIIALWDIGSPYGRVFAGRAPSVLFLNGGEAPKPNPNVQDSNISRIHFDGPIGGFGLGTLNKSKTGQIWFVEVSGSVQSLEQEEDVKMEGEIPVVVSSQSVDDHSTIYSVSLTVGVLAF